MLRSELLALLSQPESSGLEFKRDDVRPEQLAKEVVAFANLDGGTVLLGVDDDGSVSGLVREDSEAWVMEVCRSKIRPEIIPYYEVVPDVEPGKDIGVLRVPPGYTVHCSWHNDRRTYFIRVGSTSREASNEELERLYQRRGGLRAELRAVSGTGVRDLDHRRLNDYFRRVREQDVPDPDDTSAWTALLVNTEFMVEVGADVACSLAGLLLFGSNVTKYLPQAGIDAVAFPGPAKDYATLERADLLGPMTALLEEQDVLARGLVEQAVDFVRRNTGVTARLAGGARRLERPAYPEEPVRETIVNALVHRDYLLSGTRIELAVYDDRLEVTSPGRLPNGITPERMRLGTRAARNQLLKDVMRDYGYLEHLGMGVPRKIIRGMREHNNTEPDLVEEDERFLVRLWRERRH
jgi:ATP-dependent DNA helicase RecG